MYVITYDANGGFFGTGTNKTPTYITHKTENSKYTKPGSTPNKDGCILEGWYDAPTGGNRIPLGDPNYLINQDTTIYAHWIPITFEVEVQIVGNATWTQKATATSGSLTGYKITYYISEIGVNDEDAITQTSQSVSGKAEVSTYYVWAIATKGEITIKSKNYVEVYTGHIHKGKVSIKGGCYTDEVDCPKNNKYATWIYAGNIWTEFTSSSTQYCQICSKQLSTTNGGYGSTNSKISVQCLECGWTWNGLTSSSSSRTICKECWDKKDDSMELANGSILKDTYTNVHGFYTNIPYGYRPQNGTLYTSYTVSHKKSYKPACGFTEHEPKVTNIFF